MFKNILICLDGSPTDTSLTNLGIHLAKKLGSTLHGLTVQDQLSLDGPLMYDISGALAFMPQLNFLEETKKILNERATNILAAFTKACQDESVTYTAHTSLGIVHRVIAEKAELNDLTLLGRRGLNYNFDKDLLGSTTDRVIRHSSGPILTVSESGRLIENPLLAYDGSHSSKKALTTAAKLCAALQLPLTLLHVGSSEERDAKIWEEARESLAAYHILVKYEEVAGNPHQMVPQYAREHNHDLVILGSRGRSGLIQFILGSTTQYALWSGAFHVLVDR